MPGQPPVIMHADACDCLDVSCKPATPMPKVGRNDIMKMNCKENEHFDWESAKGFLRPTNARRSLPRSVPSASHPSPKDTCMCKLQGSAEMAVTHAPCTSLTATKFHLHVDLCVQLSELFKHSSHTAV